MPPASHALDQLLSNTTPHELVSRTLDGAAGMVKIRHTHKNILGVRVAILRSNMDSTRWKLLRRLHMCKQGGLVNPLHATPNSIVAEDLWATPQIGGYHTLYLWTACDQQVPVG